MPAFDRMRRLLRHPGFARLWIADALSNFGTFISTLALQLLMIDGLSANQLDIGLVRTAQWLPFMLFGFFAGVVADRIRRKYILIGADLASATLLSLISALALTGHLGLATLMGLVFLLGTAAVLQGGTHQSFTADLLPTDLLTAGNVKLSQTWTAAQTLGPLTGGVLVRTFGAPFALIADAVTFAVSAVLLSPIVETEREPSTTRRDFAEDLREGLSWVYGHPLLSPYALTLHLWFVGSSIAGTVYVYYASALGFDGPSIGMTLACAGLAGLLGSAIAEWQAGVFGLGVVVAFGSLLSGTAWGIAALAPSGGNLGFIILCTAQCFFGFGIGVRGPLEGSFRNAITPSRLRGRMNTTIRSVNWGLIGSAAPLGGLIAVRAGNRAALSVAALMMIGSGTTLLFTRYRNAVMPSEQVS